MKAPPLPRSLRRWPLLLAAALPLAATAQTAPPDSATTYKHQLGLTASPVLDGFFKNNRALPVGLLYKRQTKPNQALRARVELLYRYFEQVAPLSVKEGLSGTASRQTDYRFDIAVGKEFILPLTTRFSVYAGVEIGAFYAPSKQEFETYNGNYTAIIDGQAVIITSVDRGKTSFNALGALVQPLAGLRYQLHRRLYVEAESAAPITWSRAEFSLKSQATDYKTGTLQLGSSRGNDTYSRFSANLRLVSAVHLVVLF